MVPSTRSLPGVCTCPKPSAQPLEPSETGQEDCSGWHGADIATTGSRCQLRLSTHFSHRLSMSPAHKVMASPGHRLNLSHSRQLSPYDGRGSAGNPGALTMPECLGWAAAVAWRTMGATWLGMAQVPWKVGRGDGRTDLCPGAARWPTGRGLSPAEGRSGEAGGGSELPLRGPAQCRPGQAPGLLHT